MRTIIFSQTVDTQTGSVAAACKAAGFQTSFCPSIAGTNGTTFNLSRLGPFLDQFSEDELVLVMDEDQLTVPSNIGRFAETFAGRGLDLLFAAQFRFAFPDEGLRRFYWKFFPRHGGPLVFASAKGMIGKASALRAMLSETRAFYEAGPTAVPEQNPFVPDQVIVNRYYADQRLGVSTQPIRMALDQGQQFFKVCEALRDGTAWRRHYAIYRFERDRLEQRGNNAGNIANAALAMARTAAISIINRGDVRPSHIFRYRPNQSPEWQNAMAGFLSRLEAHIPFAFTHFNDGEMTFIQKFLEDDHRETWFGRRQNKYTRSLGGHLLEAIRYTAQNYFVGVPCGTCFPRLRALADRVRPHDAMTVPAMSLHHNLSHMPRLLSLLRGRRCLFVKNTRQDLSVFCGLGLSIDDADITTVPFRAAHDLHDEMADKRFADGAVVLMTCGMLAKTVTRHWFANNPNTTFLALGSALDDLTQRQDKNYRPYPKDLPWTGDIFQRKSFMLGRKKNPCKECFDFSDGDEA